MKFDFKRAGVLLLALVLLAAVPGKLLPAALAAENTADPYVFQYMPSQLSMAYDYTVPYFYMTPFTIQHTITREDGTPYYSGSSIPQIFNLINTAKLENGGEGAYASIAAYCADASADIRQNTRYRRINLEETTYFESSAAGKIRAVVLNSFPRKEVKVIQVRANAWLRRQGKPEITGLQSGEALLATQAAIWKLAGGERYTIDSLYSGSVDLEAASQNGYLGEVIDKHMEGQQETENTAQNVRSLFDYLCNLEAEAPRYDIISEAVFENPVYTGEKEKDGTYTVAVSITLNIPVGKRDSLTVSAACGSWIQDQPVSNAGEYHFLFQGMSGELPVVMEISGEQYGGDVYLFDAEGGHDVSQPLVGYDSSRLPVHAQVTLTREGIVDAYAGDGSAAESVPGIQLNVSAIGCSSGSFDVGESHTWIIRGSIPAGIGNARQYRITGTIDYRLTYEQGSPIVCLYTKAGNALLLRPGDHYTLEESMRNGTVIDSFFVSLTPAGMAYVSANLGRGEAAPEIHVCFDAAINENAAMGESIPNTAHLDYTNSEGVEYDSDACISEVHTGGIHIRKTDLEDNPLAGASFRLARLATEAERNDPSIEKVTWNAGEETVTAVYVSFYKDGNSEKVSEVTTAEDGMAGFYGLADGEYYLVETQAPAGYHLQAQPVAVTVNSVSHLTSGDGRMDEDGKIIDNTVRIAGSKFIMPETGGLGTTAFHVIGVSIIGAACFLLLSNRNRKM